MATPEQDEDVLPPLYFRGGEGLMERMRKYCRDHGHGYEVAFKGWALDKKHQRIARGAYNFGCYKDLQAFVTAYKPLYNSLKTRTGDAAAVSALLESQEMCQKVGYREDGNSLGFKHNKHQLCFHYEILRGDRPTRFYMDIDFYEQPWEIVDDYSPDIGCDAAAIAKREREVLDGILKYVADKINEVLQKLKRPAITPADFVVFSSSRETLRGFKFSFHVSLRVVIFKTTQVMKDFVVGMLQDVDESDKTLYYDGGKERTCCIDISVYRRNAQWRFPGSAKPEAKLSPLVPLRGEPWPELEDALLQIPFDDQTAIVEGNIVRKPTRKAKENAGTLIKNKEKQMEPVALSEGEETELTRNIKRLLAAYDADGAERMEVGKLQVTEKSVGAKRLLMSGRYKKDQERMCLFGRTHKRNNFYFLVHPQTKAVSFCCNSERCLGEKHLGHLDLEKDEFSLQRCKEDTKLSVTKYNREFLKPYDLGAPGIAQRALLVKSDMGTGKTVALEKMLADRARFQRVIILSTRSSFACMMAQRFPDFQLYKNYSSGKFLPSAALLQADRLIIQYESLHKLLVHDEVIGAFVQTFDCVVIDEVESLLANMTEKPVKSKGKQYDAAYVLRALLAHPNAYVLGLDADLGNKTVSVFRSILGSAQIRIHINTFIRQRRDVVLYVYRNTWLAQLNAAIESGKKVLIASLSKKVINGPITTIVEKINAQRENKLSFGVYTAITMKQEESSSPREIAKEWATLDVVAFTPAITVGIDFDMKDYFDVIFAYACPGSAPARVLIQMCGRCRHPKENVIHLHAWNKPLKDNWERATLKRVQIENRLRQAALRKSTLSDDSDGDGKGTTKDDVDDEPEGRGVGMADTFFQPRFVQDGDRMVLQRDWMEITDEFQRLEKKRSDDNIPDELLRLATLKGYRVSVDFANPENESLPRNNQLSRSNKETSREELRQVMSYALQGLPGQLLDNVRCCFRKRKHSTGNKQSVYLTTAELASVFPEEDADLLEDDGLTEKRVKDRYPLSSVWVEGVVNFRGNADDDNPTDRGAKRPRRDWTKIHLVVFH